MVMWSLCPYGASICGKEALFVVEAFHCRLGLILEMAYVQGRHYLFTFTLAIHCWNYDSLGGVMMCLMLHYDNLVSRPHVMLRYFLVVDVMWLLWRV